MGVVHFQLRSQNHEVHKLDKFIVLTTMLSTLQSRHLVHTAPLETPI